MKTLYDVGNDYSLDSNVSEKSRAQAETKAYKWHNCKIDGIELEIGTHKQHNEIHYVKSENSELNGWFQLR